VISTARPFAREQDDDQSVRAARTAQPISFHERPTRANVGAVFSRTSRHPPPAVAPAAGRRPAVDHDLVRMQRLAGNAAVAGAVQRNVAVQRKGGLDAGAQAIVTAAQDTKTPVADRAVALVRAILATYFAGDAGLVKAVVYDDERAAGGLNTESGNGNAAKGTISVGKDFLEQATEAGFARRVIQVDHELEHVRQHRSGLGGAGRSTLREFLAFSREALQAEVGGTGSIQHGTRLRLIDEALRLYNKLGDDDRKTYEGRRKALLDDREKHNGKGGHPRTEPPGP
jgi:hypothetical protein